MCVCHIELTILLFHRNRWLDFRLSIFTSFVCTVCARPCPYRSSHSMAEPSCNTMVIWIFSVVLIDAVSLWKSFPKTERENIYLEHVHYRAKCFVYVDCWGRSIFIYHLLKMPSNFVPAIPFFSRSPFALLQKRGKKCETKNFNMKMMNLFPIWLMSFRGREKERNKKRRAHNPNNIA